jgi:hypothetical protein
MPLADFIFEYPDLNPNIADLNPSVTDLNANVTDLNANVTDLHTISKDVVVTRFQAWLRDATSQRLFLRFF